MKNMLTINIITITISLHEQKWLIRNIFTVKQKAQEVTD